MKSEQFIEMFNEAADLARAGKQKKAFEIYEAVSQSKTGTANKDLTSSEFFGVVELRKAFCLMDLDRYPEARRILESEKMKAFLNKFEDEYMYEYFFCYGNTLGNLKETVLMEDCLSRALAIAAEQLGDMEKCETCWYFILYWGKQHKKWDFLEKQCVAAHMFGSDNGSVYLQIKALEFGCFAYNGLGKKDKARKAAEVVLERLRATGSKDSAIAEWKDFLATLSAA
jgi:hypothetical protein